MSDIGKALAYFLVGFSLFAFMAVDDVRHGRKVQRRDYHIVVVWPIVLMVIFILGLFEFSRLTSSEDGKPLSRPSNWI